jgi:hypothetical protein
MPDFPPIEMGQEYRERVEWSGGRVLATDGRWPDLPVVWERRCGFLLHLTRDGKERPGDTIPFIERVPVKQTIGVNVYRDPLGRLHVVECPEGFPGKLIATLDIEFVEGQGL